MRKTGNVYLVGALAFLLLAALVLLPSGAGPGALPREMAFTGGLHNSLYQLDKAKWKWMEEKHKTEHDIPTMQDLAPYLGDWANRIQHFIDLGVEYKLTPISEMEPQSDVATLTRDLRFQRGFCRYYPAGTSYSPLTRWIFPPYNARSWFVATYQNNRGLLAIVLVALGIGSLAMFLIQRNLRLRPARRITAAHDA